MTLRESLDWLAAYPWVLAALFSLPPVLVVVIGALHGRGGGGSAPWRYLYTVLIYLACVPGMAAAVVTTYAAVFTRESLLDMNLLISIVPIVSMVATLALTWRNVSFDSVPGFDRILGFMVMLAVTFILVLGISKTRIWLFFGSSIFNLLLLVGILIAILKWGAHLAFRNKRGSRR